ncbi:MAG: O-antigen ligase [Cyanobacteria bacterium P01_G01_bin.54]
MTLRISFTAKQAIQWTEIVFAIVGIMFFAGGFNKLGGLVTLARYGIFLVSCILLFLRWEMTIYLLKGIPFLALLSSISFVSFYWSEVQSETMVAVREILYMSAFGLYLATRYTLREQLMLLCAALQLCALRSLYEALLGSGVHGGGKFAGLWKGVYHHKNDLAAIMTLGSGGHLILLFDRNFNRLLAAGGLGFMIFMILMSGSKSGLVNIFVLVGALFLLRTIRWRNLLMIIIFATLIGTAIPVTTVFFSNWDNIMEGLGKDPTLSGRTEIWSYAMTQIPKHPYFGFGRKVFWNKRLNYRVEAGLAVVGEGPRNLLSGTYAPPHAHNGFVDTLLETGFVGLGCLGLSILLFIIRTVKRIYVTETPEDFWPLIFLTFFMMYNFTESLILLGENVFWITYVALASNVRIGAQKRLFETPSIRERSLQPAISFTTPQQEAIRSGKSTQISQISQATQAKAPQTRTSSQRRYSSERFR